MVATLSTDFLSNLATLGLKQCLARYEHVLVRVSSKRLFALLGGWVDGVEVYGTGWRSPKGVSCRSLTVRIGTVGLDLTAIWRGQIVLQQPVAASATLVLNAQDFNHFLGSTLVRKALEKLPLTDIAVAAGGPEHLVLTGMAEGMVHRFELRARPDGKATVIGAKSDLTRALEQFLNTLAVDLQGLELGLERFTIEQGLLQIQAQGRVWKFPEGGLSF